MEHYTNLFYSVYLHVFLLFCFLTILFWVVISKTEGDSINNEIINGIKGNLKDIKISTDLLSNDSIEYLKKYYEGEDSTVDRNNKQLLMFNIAFIVLLLVGFLGGVFVRYKLCGKSINWTEVLLENAIILIIVGMIEYYFFMNIASKYVPVKPSYMPSVVQKKINEL